MAEPIVAAAQRSSQTRIVPRPAPNRARQAERPLGLTRGEIECLRPAAEGLTSEEIAERLPFTTETVTTDLKAAIRKIGASNCAQAIAGGIRRGVIA